MSQPLYFFSGVTASELAPGKDKRLSRSVLARYELADVFSDLIGPQTDCAACDVTGKGPNGEPGVVLCYQRPDGALPPVPGYRAQTQLWHPIRGSAAGLWIGWEEDSPPAPEDMIRKRAHNGYAIELADGNRWRIPVIRRPDGSTELPTDLFWDDDGGLREPIKAAYADYWNETDEVSRWFFETGFDGGETTFTKIRALALAVRALGINYRFGRHEQNLLRLIDSDSYLSVLGITVDLPKVNVIAETLDPQKKSETQEPPSLAPQTGPENTTPGPPADCPATDPAEATCS